MLRAFANVDGRLQPVEQAADQIDRVVWIDLFGPSEQEEASVGELIGISIPSREAMEEIEISSRLYHEDGVYFMTATLPAQADSDDPHMAPVTFALAGRRLITVRHHEPRAFQTFSARAQKMELGCTDGETVLVALLEAVVDRLADILERAGRETEAISRGVFQHSDAGMVRSRDFQDVLEQIGRKGELTSHIRDSLVTLDRLVGYLGQVMLQNKADKELRARVKTLARDVRSLTDHASFLAQKITFLLDATLGMISIEQNAIIKIFSVAAVAFLPPTLIASIYGMNFEFMPEIDWPFGYPFAIGLMIASAVIPFLYFKRRGWL